MSVPARDGRTNLIVQALVEVVAILEVRLADLGFVCKQESTEKHGGPRQARHQPDTRDTSFWRACTCFLSSANSASILLAGIGYVGGSIGMTML